MLIDPTAGVGYAFGQKFPSADATVIVLTLPRALDAIQGGTYALLSGADGDGTIEFDGTAVPAAGQNGFLRLIYNDTNGLSIRCGGSATLDGVSGIDIDVSNGGLNRSAAAFVGSGIAAGAASIGGDAAGAGFSGIGGTSTSGEAGTGVVGVGGAKGSGSGNGVGGKFTGLEQGSGVIGYGGPTTFSYGVEGVGSAEGGGGGKFTSVLSGNALYATATNDGHALLAQAGQGNGARCTSSSGIGVYAYSGTGVSARVEGSVGTPSQPRMVITASNEPTAGEAGALYVDKGVGDKRLHVYDADESRYIKVAEAGGNETPIAWAMISSGAASTTVTKVSAFGASITFTMPNDFQVVGTFGTARPNDDYLILLTTGPLQRQLLWTPNPTSTSDFSLLAADADTPTSNEDIKALNWDLSVVIYQIKT